MRCQFAISSSVSVNLQIVLALPLLVQLGRKEIRAIPNALRSVIEN